MYVKAYFKEKAETINRELKKYIENNDPYKQGLFDAMGYSLFAGGKRLRPVLMLAACEMFGGRDKDAYPYACALEMIHTYSLIHDDLPAMDNDDLRRGKPTNHKVFGEDMAILAGDGLLSYAFEIMAADALNKNEIKYLKALKAIADAAGVNGMVAGQAVDVKSEGEKISALTLDYIHLNKTAAMIRGAVAAGAYIGGASDDDVKCMIEAAEKIGIAFQIEDDILDITSTTEVLGKNIMSDIKNEKQTYASMYGIAYSKEKISELSGEAISIIKSLDRDGKTVEEIIKYLINRAC